MPDAKDTWNFEVKAQNLLPKDHPEKETYKVSITPTGPEERDHVHQAFIRFLLACLEIKGDTVEVQVDEDMLDPNQP